MPARAAWDALTEPDVLSLELAWEAVQTGNIGVGAVVTDSSGAVVATGRNRVLETDAPPGQLAGCSLAHAEVNALARLRFRADRELTLTTTLQPCLQCAAAIRMAPIAELRILGADPLWDGCHDFRPLGGWAARRAPVPADGPRTDAVGRFATFVARLGPGLVPHVVEGLRECGEGPLLDVVAAWADRTDELAAVSVREAFDALWPDLVPLTT